MANKKIKKNDPFSFVRFLMAELDEDLTKLEKKVDLTKEEINKEKNKILDQMIKDFNHLKSKDL